MNRYEEMQYYLIEYRDALSVIDEKHDTISDIERRMLLLSKSFPLEIAERIVELVKYSQIGKRHNNIDIGGICNQVDEIYYLVSIADNTLSASEAKGRHQNKKTLNIIFPRHDSDKVGTETNNICSDRNKEKIIKISDMSYGARFIFENNPFCVLGISSTSSETDIVSIVNELKETNLSGNITDYYSSLDLDNVEMPDRSASHLLQVLNKADYLSCRWLWFRDIKRFQYTWESFKVYYPGSVDFDYDRLIVAYISLLLTNPKMDQWYYWNRILSTFKSLYDLDDEALYKILQPSLPDSERNKHDCHTVAESFRGAIFTPYIMSVGDNNESAFIDKIEKLRENTTPDSSYDVLYYVAFIIAKNKIKKIANLVDEIEKDALLNDKQMELIDNITESFFENDYATVKRICTLLKGIEWYAEELENMILVTVKITTEILCRIGLKDKACKYDCIIFTLCNKEQQRQIIASYPYGMQNLPDDAYTIADCKNAILEVKTNAMKLQWMIKAANKGDLELQYVIGKCYKKCQGICIDPDEAVKLYDNIAFVNKEQILHDVAIFYYYGDYPCTKDLIQAKDYLIRAAATTDFKDESIIDDLNEKFPDWQRSNHPCTIIKSCNDSSKLRRMADIGVPSAECLYGHHLYYGINGCGKNREKARRYLLLSSAHKYSEADRILSHLFDINTKEARTPKGMYECGNKYSKKKSTKAQDLMFYWYYRAYHAGYQYAAIELGECYQEGYGTDTNFDLANQLFSAGIELDDAASCYYYGKNLFYNNGISKESNKAIEYLQKSAKLGDKRAKKFLLNIINIEFTICDFKEYNNVIIALTKVTVIPQGLYLVFNYKNMNYKPRLILMERCCIDGNMVFQKDKTFRLKSNYSATFEYIIKGVYMPNVVSIVLEMEDVNASHIVTFPELVLTFNAQTGSDDRYYINVIGVFSFSDTIPLRNIEGNTFNSEVNQSDLAIDKDIVDNTSIETTGLEKSKANVPNPVSMLHDDNSSTDISLKLKNQKRRKYKFNNLSYEIFGNDRIYIEFNRFIVEEECVGIEFGILNFMPEDIVISAVMCDTKSKKKLHIGNVNYLKGDGIKYAVFWINDISVDQICDIKGYLIVRDQRDVEILRTNTILINTDLENLSHTCTVVKEKNAIQRTAKNKGIESNIATRYYNYAWNLYYGLGVDIDIDKAFDYMVTASNMGNYDAYIFLYDNYGVTRTNYILPSTFEFETCYDICFSFDKISVTSQGIELTFAARNFRAGIYEVYLEYYIVDGKRNDCSVYVAQIKTQSFQTFTYMLNGIYSVRKLSFVFRVYDFLDNTTFLYPKIYININNDDGKVIAHTYCRGLNKCTAFEDDCYGVLAPIHTSASNIEIYTNDIDTSNQRANTDTNICSIDADVAAIETSLQTCELIEDASVTIEDDNHAEVDSQFISGRDVNVSRKTSSTFMDEPTNIGTSLYDSDDAFVGFLNFEIDDNRTLFNFWIRNKSDKTISVALRNVYVDEKRDFLYISLGQFNPGATSFKSHWFPSIIPISYYSIKSCIYIYDEGGNCMSKGDAFRINVDFDYNTSSVENGD